MLSVTLNPWITLNEIEDNRFYRTIHNYKDMEGSKIHIPPHKYNQSLPEK